MKQRHFPFFPEHWKGEVGLRMVSSAARGLWIDMMCEMHSAQPYGHLATPTGVPIVSVEQIARIVGESAADVKRWLGELEAAQVFSRDADGTIFSRRMVRDAEGREAWRDRQNRARQSRDTDVTDHPSSRESHADVTRESRESHASKGKGKGKRDTDDTKAKASVSGSQRVVPTVEPGPDFGDLEADVLAFLATVAAENKTGKIVPARIATLRRELEDALTRRLAENRDAFAHGLREAIRRGVGNVNYAVKAASGYTPLIARTNVSDAFGDAAIGNGDVPWSDDTDALPDFTTGRRDEAES